MINEVYLENNIVKTSSEEVTSNQEVMNRCVAVDGADNVPHFTHHIHVLHILNWLLFIWRPIRKSLCVCFQPENTKPGDIRRGCGQRGCDTRPL